MYISPQGSHFSAGILGPYGGPTYNKLQHLVLNAHSLPLSVQNEIPKVENQCCGAVSMYILGADIDIPCYFGPKSTKI